MSATAALVFLCLSPQARDGDSLMCATDGAPSAIVERREVRLAAIDAADHPKSRKCTNPRTRAKAWCDLRAYEAGKAALGARVAGRRVTCRLVDASPNWAGFQWADRYGRPIVRCTVGRTDLSTAMLNARVVRRWP